MTMGIRSALDDTVATGPGAEMRTAAGDEIDIDSLIEMRPLRRGRDRATLSGPAPSAPGPTAPRAHRNDPLRLACVRRRGAARPPGRSAKRPSSLDPALLPQIDGDRRRGSAFPPSR